MTRTPLFAAPAAVLALLLPLAAWAQLIVKDEFTGATTRNSWKWFNGACLTAGDGTNGAPSCMSLKDTYYQETLVGGASGTLPDLVGSGALRFTNGYPGGYHQNGAIVSQLNPGFSTKQGIQVVFTTVTYRGDSGGGGRDGADGISFYLMDAAQPAGIGAWGGSLGYSCSNTNPPYNGLVGAYIGLGVDEFGNFLNGGPNRSATFPGWGPDNTASGWGYQPGRIGLRGAGNVAWSWLNANYSNYYPSWLTSSQQQSAVQSTCSTGYLWDYSTPSNPRQTASTVTDYPAIPGAYDVLSNVQIANESAQKRGDGTPITYKLKITSDGLLSFAYSLNGGAYNPVITNQDITTTAGAPLPSSLQFGFAGSTGGDTNIHEIMCFQATPADVSASSGGINQPQTGKLITGSQLYFAQYNPTTWAGSLTAHYLQAIDANTVGIVSPANWDASCVLTGVGTGQTCASTGAGPMAAEGPTQRRILTWSGTQGIPFQWSSLSSSERNALIAGDATATSDRLNYLRGDRTKEITTTGSGSYRDRTSLLGDIIDSSPAWVGPPSAPYPGTWMDRLRATASIPENAAGAQSYLQFASSAQTRTNVVYAGANDGFMHGLRAGAYNAANQYDTTSVNDGYELLAYMPNGIVQTIHNSSTVKLDFSDPRYAHNFYVDATAGTGDLFYANAWHTWLIGGLGTGGFGIYALDITNPAAFGESNAAKLVIGDWTYASAPTSATSPALTCVNVAGCAANLGNLSGVPQIRRFHNGTWGAVFGNGFGSTSGDAGIYIMTVDSSGSISFYYLSAGKSGSKDGIAYVTPADLDGDHITDYVYAGDLLGNVWRFDVTSSNPNAWAASGAPLFSTPAGQPITTKVIVAAVPSNTSAPRIMVEFGTGQQTPFTLTSPTQYAAGAQALYGIWDWNTSGWNSQSTITYASLTAPQSVDITELQAQTMSSVGSGLRSVTSNGICWQGSSGCSGARGQYGWVLSLPGTSTNSTTNPVTTSNEQVVYSPILELGVFIVNTTIAPSTTPLSCSADTPTGWTIAVSPATGGAFPFSFFPNNNNLNVNGIAWNGVGSGSVVSANGNYFLATQTVDGAGSVSKVLPPAGTKGGRLTWIERR